MPKYKIGDKVIYQVLGHLEQGTIVHVEILTGACPINGVVVYTIKETTLETKKKVSGFEILEKIDKFVDLKKE